jgi:hypothetical protein
MPELNSRRKQFQAILDWLLIAGLLALVLLLGCFRQRDTDIWWHLKTGQMILDGGKIPVKDWFTFTSADRDWIDLHWLFQVTAAKLYSAGGLELLTAVAATLGAVAVGVLLTARRSEWSWPIAIACWIPIVFLLTGRMYVRPEVVTLVCMASSLAILFHANSRPRLIWALLPLQILWVNVQGLFILGIVLAGFYWVDGVWLHLRRRPDSRLGQRTGLLAALGVASFFNPYHVHGLIFPLELFRKMSWDASFYSKHIAELQSIPQFIEQAGVWNFYILLHFGVTALAALSFLFIWSRRRFDLFRFLTFASFAWLGLQATRNSGQFALAAGAVTAWNFGEWFASRATKPTSPRDPQSSILHPLVTRAALLLILVAAAGSVVTGHFYALAGEGRQFGLGEHPLWHAHDAARFAARPGMPDRMLAFHLGHAAVFEFHKRDDQRTFCDPRLEVVSRQVIEEYHEIEAAIGQDKTGWQALLGRHNIRMILTDHRGHYPIEATLLLAPEWRCTYFDPVAAVFVRAEVADEIETPPVNFATGVLLPGDAVPELQFERQGSARMRLAESLYLIGRSLSERPDSNLKLAHQVLLRAARLLAVEISEATRFEELRLVGQVSFSLSQLPPVEDEAITDPAMRHTPSQSEWLAGAERQFREALALRPDDFIVLVHLYSIAQIQHNVAEQIRLGERIISLRHTTPDRRLIRDRIAAELAALRRAEDSTSREERSLDPR